MSTLSLRLPESLHKELRRLAKQEGISLNQFIASAAAEKLAALRTATYLKKRAKRGDREAFEKVLAKVPDVPAPEWDSLDAEAAEQAAAADGASRRR